MRGVGCNYGVIMFVHVCSSGLEPRDVTNKSLEELCFSQLKYRVYIPTLSDFLHRFPWSGCLNCLK